jgi:hypothetical protein
LVEFAIILPLLVLLLVMAVDFGRVFFGWVALQNGARIAADFAARAAESWPEDQAVYRNLVISDLTAINCAPPPAFDADGDGEWDAADVPDPVFLDVDANTETTNDGDHAWVELGCRFDLLTPLASAITGNPVALGAEAFFPINGVLVPALPTPEPTPPGPCPAPTALFEFVEDPVGGSSATDGEGDSPLSIDFTDTSVDDPDCPITSWEWDFQSDGTVDSDLQNPADILFVHPGSGGTFKTFVVELTVTTDDGMTSSTSDTIRVRRS